MLSDLTRETTVTTGDGDITLDGAPTGFVSFASSIPGGVGGYCYYEIRHRTNGQWEIGRAQLTSGSTLSRLEVFSNYLLDTSFVDFAAGTKDVFVTAPAKAFQEYEHSQDSASTTWTVSHYLNKYPSVTVVNSAKEKVCGYNLTYTNKNVLVLSFSAAFSGKAYLN